VYRACAHIHCLLFHVNASTMRILHLADIHFDPYYLYGAEANCGDPLCCRFNSTPPANKSGTR
jgi:hypothetical protein